jgi:WD40 repeat protein
VCVWDTTKLRLDPAAPVLLTNIAAWRFSPDSQSVLTVDREGRVVQWKGAQFQERERLMEIGPIARHANPTCDALISEDGRWLAAAATNGTVRLWDLPPRSPPRELGTNAGWPALWKFLSQGKSLVLPLSDGYFHEWDLTSGQETRSWRAVRNPRMGAFSSDGRWCLTVGRGDAPSMLRNLVTGHEVQTQLHIITADAAFSPDGGLFAVASEEGFVKLWQTASMQEVATLGGFMLGVHSVAFSPDGRRLVAGSNDKEAVKVWGVESHRELLTLEGEGGLFASTAFSPDGNILGSMNNRGELHLWRAPSWAEIEAAEKTLGN